LADLAITGIGHLTTNDGDPIRDAAVFIEGGRITYVGTGRDAPMTEGGQAIDCGGMAVIPGFVDSHTHLVFAGDRSWEFSRRMAGESYLDIAAGGGGIMSTVRSTRSASTDELFEGALARLARMIAAGTTAIEVKSGYGLDLETELRVLEVARMLGDETGVEVRTTFLGAHAVPEEFAHDRAGYVELVTESMLPAVVGLADDCDVFVERGAFNVDEGRAILNRAAELGLGLRVHAEQLSHSGGAQLAAEVGAMSADHLDHATMDDAAALAEAGVVAVLTPGASHMMRSPQAPGPMLWDTGCTVAIATDCNPGTSYVEGMTLVVSLAVVAMGLTVEQAIWSATRGGALAIGQEDRGVVRAGAPGDLVILDAPNPEHLAYRPATNLVAATIIGGTKRTGVNN
jgi:imidazolonepropionase